MSFIYSLISIKHYDKVHEKFFQPPNGRSYTTEEFFDGDVPDGMYMVQYMSSTKEITTFNHFLVIIDDKLFPISGHKCVYGMFISGATLKDIIAWDRL